MTRWLGQRDGFRCGPIALVNVMKWANIKQFEGHDVNEKLARGYLSVRCRTDRDGTWNKYIRSILKKLPGIRIAAEIKQPSLRVIKQCIDMGGIAMISGLWYCHQEKEYVWHYSIVADYIGKGQYYILINGIKGQTQAITKRHKLYKALKEEGSSAYLIYKEKI